MPQAAAALRLAGDVDVLVAEIYDGETGRMLARATWAPAVARADLPMAENGECHLIATDYGLVRHPIIGSLRIERTQSRAVGLHGPRALRRFAAGFPTENDFVRHPGI